jgi:hypothetical protein
MKLASTRLDAQTLFPKARPACRNHSISKRSAAAPETNMIVHRYRDIDRAPGRSLQRNFEKSGSRFSAKAWRPSRASPDLPKQSSPVNANFCCP